MITKLDDKELQGLNGGTKYVDNDFVKVVGKSLKGIEKSGKLNIIVKLADGTKTHIKT